MATADAREDKDQDQGHDAEQDAAAESKSWTARRRARSGSRSQSYEEGRLAKVLHLATGVSDDVLKLFRRQVEHRRVMDPKARAATVRAAEPANRMDSVSSSVRSDKTNAGTLADSTGPMVRD